MNKLNLYHRPWVLFDPANRDHRKYYHEFLQRRTWGYCPVRFVVGDDTSDLVTMIQRNLIDYYVGKEFLGQD
jgi:hypothetical protein